MIHLIVFLVKILIKAFSKNKAEPKTTSDKKTTATTGKHHRDNTNQKAVGITIFTSLCCFINMLLNPVLALVNKDWKSLSFSIFLLGVFVSTAYYGQEERKKIETALSEINYTEKLELDIYERKVMEQQLKSYLRKKMQVLISIDALDKDGYDKYNHRIDFIADDILNYKFNHITSGSDTFSNTINAIYELNDTVGNYNSYFMTITVDMNEYTGALSADFENDIRDLAVETKWHKSPWFIFCAISLMTGWIFSVVLTFLLVKKTYKKSAAKKLESNKADSYTEPQSKRSKPAAKPIAATKSSTETVTKTQPLININSCDATTLITLTMLSYSQALLIIQERREHGAYANASDLQSRNKLSDDFMLRVRDKISF